MKKLVLDQNKIKYIKSSNLIYKINKFSHPINTYHVHGPWKVKIIIFSRSIKSIFQRTTTINSWFYFPKKKEIVFIFVVFPFSSLLRNIKTNQQNSKKPRRKTDFSVIQLHLELFVTLVYISICISHYIKSVLYFAIFQDSGIQTKK